MAPLGMNWPTSFTSDFLRTEKYHRGQNSASSTSNFRVAELVKSFDVPFIAESLDDFRYG
jgi:hypothetical protein